MLLQLSCSRGPNCILFLLHLLELVTSSAAVTSCLSWRNHPLLYLSLMLTLAALFSATNFETRRELRDLGACWEKNKNKECALSGFYKPERCETWKADRKWKICRFHTEVLIVHGLQQGSPVAAADCTADTSEPPQQLLLLCGFTTFPKKPLNNIESA